MIDHPLTCIQTELGYYRLDPLPTESELHEFYKDRYYQDNHAQYSHNYPSEEIEWFRLDGRVANAIVRSTNIEKLSQLTLLDVGCGEGFFSAELQALGWSVRCCDFSNAGISQHNPSLLGSFEAGNIYEILEKTIIDGASYDLVNLANVLEHVIDPVSLLSLLHRVISDTGMLRIVVPNDFSELQLRLLATNRIRDKYWLTPEHLNYFNFSSLRKIVEVSGLKIARVLSDFPIENFLLNEHSNYKSHPTRGRAAHLARCELDLFYSQQLDDFIQLMEAQARLGIGRDVVMYLSRN